LGAVRKGFFTYKNMVTTIAKLTLNGVFYDFDKQAKEGLVVCGAGYQSATFFLPEDKFPMTSEDGENMTINSYFEMLATTDYAVIIAWDYFAQYLSSLVSSTDLASIEIPYTMYSMKDGNILVSGASIFSGITTAKDFFAILYNTMSQDNNPLSYWMEEDGTVSFVFRLQLGDEALAFNLYLGKK
jgi:hypothetical protein